MPTKKEIFDKLDTDNKATYTTSEVKAIVNSLRRESQKPSSLKKGDVYVSNVGGKKRPVVICKVAGDAVVGIPLSTTEDPLNLIPFNSRFCGENYMTRQIITSTYEHAMENFTGVFDNNTAINKAMRELKEFYNEIL